MAAFSGVVGIDLGTTYSAIAHIDQLGQPQIIPNLDNERVTPSVVSLQGDRILVGRIAKDVASASPETTVQFVKTDMGRRRKRFTLAEQQSRDDPSALDRFLDVRRKIRDCRRPPRQAIERFRKIACKPRRLDIELLDDSMKIGILQLQYLVNPVHEFDIWVAAHLAEYRSGLDGLVTDLVELAEQCGPTDFCHLVVL
jgi:hypothetical protein